MAFVSILQHFSTRKDGWKDSWFIQEVERKDKDSLQRAFL